MNRVKKMIRSLVVAMLLCAMLATTAFAAGEGSVWLNTTASTDETTALIVTNITVTDGLVELTYDSGLLTYADIEVNAEYVAMHAVNAEEPGVVKISWVAPEAYEATGDGIWLVKVTFSGVEEDSTITVSGNVNNGSVTPAVLDTSVLEEVIAEAEGLYEDNYTRKSYAAMEDALEAAKEVLADPTATQEEIDAAAASLRGAIDALELKRFVDTSKLVAAIMKGEAVNESLYTEESYAAVEEALAEAKAVLADPDATQQEVDLAAQALCDAIDALETTTPVTNIVETIKKFLKGFFGWFKP